MNIIIAEAISTEPIRTKNGKDLHSAMILDSSSEKYRLIDKILKSKPCSFYLKINEYLSTYLGITTPFVFVTDWTDPREVIGLRLECNGQYTDYPDLCFLAFYTDWENISESGIESIFAHELSHMWISQMGFDFTLSKSNKFHTCTAITDRYMAFSEGFAEHFEIVTKELMGFSGSDDAIWDQAFDINAWLSLRDSELRIHAAKNNRFIYHTAIPCQEDFDSYQNLHIAHITSSAFTPEKLKNGLQMLSSEGVISAFFYRVYKNELFKITEADEGIYKLFGVNYKDIQPVVNLYIKILYSLSKIDLTKKSLFTDFISAYCGLFPEEKDEMINIFTRITHFTTIDHEAAGKFGSMYRIGRRGNIEEFKSHYKALLDYKDTLSKKLAEGSTGLSNNVYDSIWIEGDEEINPVPWEPGQKVKYLFDANAATEIDFLSIRGLTLEDCKKIVETREKLGGFSGINEFENEVNRYRNETPS